METFTITITQSTEKVEQVAYLLGWNGAGSYRDFVLDNLAPIIQSQVADIMLEPAKNAQAKHLAKIQEDTNKAIEELSAMKDEIIETIIVE